MPKHIQGRAPRHSWQAGQKRPSLEGFVFGEGFHLADGRGYSTRFRTENRFPLFLETLCVPALARRRADTPVSRCTPLLVARLAKCETELAVNFLKGL